MKLHIILFFLPLIIGNIIHMIVVKKDYFSFLKVPISVRLFGQNKTLRGFVLLPFVGGLVACLFSLLLGPITTSILRDIIIGGSLCFIYMLSELPNSFIKRRMGIAAGQYSNRYKIVQLFIDKMDSILGVLLFYYIIVPISLQTIVILFVIAFILHILLSYLLVLLKIKKSI